MSAPKRRFVPTSEYVGGTTIRTRISHYIWTRGGGLRVHFLCGTSWKSEYTLPELLDSKEARETTLDGGRMP